MVELLPEGYKNVLKLSVLQGLSHKEIGTLLGIEPHSSSSQLARAKEMMRKNVKRYGILLLALLAVIIPFLLPEKEQEQKPETAEKTPKKGGESVTPEKEEIKTDTTKQKILVPIAPILPNNLVAQQMDTLCQTDSTRTYIAEVVEEDTLEVLPVDSTKEERHAIPNTVPNIQPNDRMVAEENNTNKNETAPIIERKDGNEWQLAVSFAGGNVNIDNLLASSPTNPDISSGWQDPMPPYDNPSGIPDTLATTRMHYYMPLTFGFSLSKSLSPRWSVESGLRYTLLRSDVTTTTVIVGGSVVPTTETTEQKLHYIGIPLKLTYNLWRTPSFSLYTSGGAAADIPIGSSNPVLWSINFGAGFQYQLTPSISLYTEPSLNYYLNPNSGTPTIRTDRPFEFTIPVGLRFSW